jgi:hypothetical protein
MTRRARAGYGAPPEPGCGAPFTPDADGFDANARDGYGPPPTRAPQQAPAHAPPARHPVEGARDSYAPACAPVGHDFAPPPGMRPHGPSLAGCALVALALLLVPFAGCAGCTCVALGARALQPPPAQAPAPVQCK